MSGAIFSSFFPAIVGTALLAVGGALMAWAGLALQDAGEAGRWAAMVLEQAQVPWREEIRDAAIRHPRVVGGTGGFIALVGTTLLADAYRVFTYVRAGEVMTRNPPPSVFGAFWDLLIGLGLLAAGGALAAYCLMILVAGESTWQWLQENLGATGSTRAWFEASGEFPWPIIGIAVVLLVFAFLELYGLRRMFRPAPLRRMKTMEPIQAEETEASPLLVRRGARAFVDWLREKIVLLPREHHEKAHRVVDALARVGA